MIKILLTVAVSVGSLADLAMAQGKQNEVSSQCAHRRVMPPDPRDDCARRLRSDAQLGYGQGGAAAGGSTDGQASGAGPGNGAGNGIGPGGNGNGIGPGGNGNGQGKGRR